ncbi:stage III sporulation protein AA [Insulibacter thermoxylanivorax]|uniref:Stage III sporulation protein AA n=1 Tax=Insulibacter thermoxylanivorax TaxID=2749268 RepID=A0A916VE19_9BACL|nr:stage III sporulation protein AA [Insulibacter thermoxylanivorax]
MLTTLFDILPDVLAGAVSRLAPSVLDSMEELRVREGRPLEVGFDGRYAFITASGELTVSPSAACYRPDRQECMKLLDIVTNHSLYSFEEELRRGYITVRGGHRVGIAGRAVLDGGKVKLLRDISAFNIRIAREVKGAAEGIIRWLIDPLAGTVHHTLVISPPQCGKTTLIRDLARILSEGSWNQAQAFDEGRRLRGLKVGIVDERSEIAASVGGVPSFDLGPRTDVLDACPKAEGMMMMIRSLSPHVLVVDEIGRSEDAEAILEAMHAGIKVVATAHGRNPEEVKKRPGLAPLFTAPLFQRYVVLAGTGRQRRQTVFDEQMRCLGPPLERTAEVR